MHAELVVPDLLPDAGEPRFPPAPALELMFARARRASGARGSYEHWIAAQCGLADGAALPAGALTLLAEGGVPGDAVWMRADPVHLELGRTDLRFAPASALQVEAAESAALVETLNRHYPGDLHFEAARPQHWCVRLATLPALAALPTAEVAGRDVDASLPQGADATAWHARLNEVQMLLHAHPVNTAREARGAPALNSLWFWGAGALPASGGVPWQSVSAEEPVARGLALQGGRRAQRLPVSGTEWLDRMPEEGRHLAVLDALRSAGAARDGAGWTDALSSLDADWIAPLLAALRRGRIGMLTLHVPDGRESSLFELVRGDLRRFWRRRRPLSAYT